jgi:hypothetical protein
VVVAPQAKKKKIVMVSFKRIRFIICSLEGRLSGSHAKENMRLMSGRSIFSAKQMDGE